MPKKQSNKPKAATERAIARSEQRFVKHLRAIEWALGTRGDFRIREDGEGLFWWRHELAKRAGLQWDGKRWVDV